MHQFFDDDEWNFLTTIALGATYHRAADVGEVFAVADALEPGDPASWVRGWTDMADRVAAAAEASAAAGHALSAARAYLRASLYHSTASFQADAAGIEGGFAEGWERHAGAFDRFVDLLGAAGGHHVERLAIPYEGTSLPGYLFRPAAAGDAPNRVLVFNNGSDGPYPAAWVQGVADALDRGWTAVMVDGPGENAALVRQGLHFRFDWEAVITPVVDALVARPDVDAERLALLGVSQGGYWVTRAVAFEHRLAAAVVDPGVTDVFAAMSAQWDDDAQALIDAGDRQGFDDAMAAAEQFVPGLAATLAFRGRPYGDDAFAMFAGAQQHRLDDATIAQITTPLLVTSPEGETFWPGQAEALAAKLPGVAELVTFSAAEGADLHCEPAGNAVRGQRIFDWLDTVVPAS